MIKDFEFYHGAVLAKIAQSSDKVIINPYPSRSHCSYIVNGKVGLYIKHSSNRLTPWGFSFAKEHQDEIQAMAAELDDVFVALVCGRDGIACLSYEQLKMVLDEEHGDHEWVRISRRPREKYAVKGSNGKLKFKIADTHFPQCILDEAPVSATLLQRLTGSR